MSLDKEIVKRIDLVRRYAREFDMLEMNHMSSINTMTEAQFNEQFNKIGLKLLKAIIEAHAIIAERARSEQKRIAEDN